MKKPFVIGVISQKGGVGKTTVSINLALALRLMNHKVLLVDGDTSNPSIGLALGMEDAEEGFKEVISTSKAKLDAFIATHSATGMHLLLGILHAKPFFPTKIQEDRLKKKLRTAKYDFIVIDMPPGYYTDYTFKFWDEGLIVATPDMSAVTGVLRLHETFKRTKTKCNLILNMVRGTRYELRAEEIEHAWGGKVLAELPRDDAVVESFAEHVPVMIENKNSQFSKAIRLLAEKYTRGDKQKSTPRRLFVFK